jgi:hypothetical protein
MHFRTTVLILLALAGNLQAEPLGEYWGTAEEEAKYYRIVEVPIPEGMALEAGSFEILPDNRLAIGTRRGNIFLVDGAFDENPQPQFKRFASGLDEVTGLSFKDGAFYVTQQTEVSRISDTDFDGRSARSSTRTATHGSRFACRNLTAPKFPSVAGA